MHAILFQAKRAHLCAVARGKRVLRAVRSKGEELEEETPQVITPARFDLLYAIYTAEPDSVHWKHTATQAHVREILGLHLSTVSKMITRLIQLGLLTQLKNHDPYDRRRRVVRFTPVGLELFHRALKLAFQGRSLTTLLHDHASGATTRPRSRRRWRVHAAIYELLSTLKRLAWRLGDWASGLYRPLRTGTTDRQSLETAAVRRMRKECAQLVYNKIHNRPRVINPPALQEDAYDADEAHADEAHADEAHADEAHADEADDADNATPLERSEPWPPRWLVAYDDTSYDAN